MGIMWWRWFYFIISLHFKYINTNENEFHCKNKILFIIKFLIKILVYMDNQTLCNQEIIYLKNVHIGRIYSHIDFHVNKYIFLL